MNIKCLETGVSHKFILDSESQEIEFEGKCHLKQWRMVFFHSNYSSDILSSISDNFLSWIEMKNIDFLKMLDVIELGSLNWKVSQYIESILNENEKNIWSLIGGILGTLSEIYDNQEFKTYVEGFVLHCKSLAQIMKKVQIQKYHN